MKNRTLPNLSLIALTASCLMQAGAQLFAIVVMVRTIIAAPPRSFALLEGEYGYDSSTFWEIVPMVTLALFVIALFANWRKTRRNLVSVALALFLGAGMLAGIVVEPEFAKLIEIGYGDFVDPALQTRAARWYAHDLGVWLISLAAGITLLLALARPLEDR